MKKTAKIVLIVGAAALGATAAYSAAPPQDQQTPKSWSWTTGKGGKRVERPSEVTRNPDGSTREVIRNGKCVTIKERSAAGEYKETRQCDPS
jgi:hypothetical protein